MRTDACACLGEIKRRSGEGDDIPGERERLPPALEQNVEGVLVVVLEAGVAICKVDQG